MSGAILPLHPVSYIGDAYLITCTNTVHRTWLTIHTFYVTTRIRCVICLSSEDYSSNQIPNRIHLFYFVLLYFISFLCRTRATSKGNYKHLMDVVQLRASTPQFPDI